MFFLQRWVDPDVHRQSAQTLRARPQAKAFGAAEEVAQSEEGVPATGEASRGQDPLARRHHSARDGRLRPGRPQRQGLQPGRDQGRDDRPLHRRVLALLQARQTRTSRYRCHALFALHPAQINGHSHSFICVLGHCRGMIDENK